MKMKRLRLKATGAPSRCAANCPTASGQTRIVFTRKGYGKKAACSVLEVPKEWAEEKLEPLGWFEEVLADAETPTTPDEPKTIEPSGAAEQEAKQPEPAELRAEVHDEPTPGDGDGMDVKPTVAELVNANKKDVLLEMAARQGVTIHERANKTEIAEALLANWSQ